jgi:hypothetical protein
MRLNPGAFHKCESVNVNRWLWEPLLSPLRFSSQELRLF